MHAVQWNSYPEKLQTLHLQQDSINRIGENPKDQAKGASQECLY